VFYGSPSRLLRCVGGQKTADLSDVVCPQWTLLLRRSMSAFEGKSDIEVKSFYFRF
jgi:hypothetical protein